MYAFVAAMSPWPNSASPAPAWAPVRGPAPWRGWRSLICPSGSMSRSQRRGAARDVRGRTIPDSNEGQAHGSRKSSVPARRSPGRLPKPSDWRYAEEPSPRRETARCSSRSSTSAWSRRCAGWMNDSRSYIPPWAIGEVMRGFAAGEVIASNHPGLAVGDHVSGLLGVQEYAVANGERRLQGGHRSSPRSRPISARSACRA